MPPGFRLEVGRESLSWEPPGMDSESQVVVGDFPECLSNLPFVLTQCQVTLWGTGSGTPTSSQEAWLQLGLGLEVAESRTPVLESNSGCTRTLDLTPADGDPGHLRHGGLGLSREWSGILLDVSDPLWGLGGGG